MFNCLMIFIYSTRASSTEKHYHLMTNEISMSTTNVYHEIKLSGFCLGRALAPFALKNSRRLKKPQTDGTEGSPNFSNQKTMKSDFHNMALAF